MVVFNVQGFDRQTAHSNDTQGPRAKTSTGACVLKWASGGENSAVAPIRYQSSSDLQLSDLNS